MNYLKRFILQLGFFTAIYSIAAVVVDPHMTGPLHLLAPSQIDDRLPKAVLFKEFASKGPVDGLVLGSSRSLAISPRLLGRLTGSRYFNMAASGALISTIADIYDDVLRDTANPRHIILGLDINNLLGRRKVEDRRKAIASGAVIPRLTQLAIDFKSTLHIDFAQDMWRRIRFEAGLLPRHAGNVFDPDGGLANKATNISEESYQKAVSTCAATMHAQLLRFDIVSDSEYADLERTLARASSSGAVVDIFVTPFNPVAEEQITKGTLYPLLRREVMLRLSRELGRRIHRIYEPVYDPADMSSLRVGVGVWFDCIHYSAEPNGNTIIREILRSGQD